MIAFKYSKTEGAEFISHLDTLRHLNKTFKRAGFEVKHSQGFHPHMLVYMSSPIGVGLKSYAEYCTVDVDISAEQFKEEFNRYSPKGIKCIEACAVEKNPNFASVITRAKYVISGLHGVNAEEVMAMQSFTVKDKHGEPKEVREKIYSFTETAEGHEVVLAAGNNALRPDAFVKRLAELYGEMDADIVKTESYVGEGDSVATALSDIG
ncbi:MAG: DUF2344 domain-containing protein [Clostridia bacterium]|nr:DUF2344 domain-containing protein [Clostridia bacterium]